MSTYQIELPESVFSSLRKTPTEFIQELKKAAAVKWYELGEISQEKAVEISGLSRLEFIQSLSKYKVSILQYTDEILDYEMNNVEE